MIIIVITGCSCVGKTTLAELLLKKFDKLQMVETYTNRLRREDDFNHSYITLEEVKESIEREEFAHLEEVYVDTYYGNKKQNIDQIFESGKVPLVVTSNIGALTYKNKYDICLINLIPKHINIISKRLLQNRPQLNLIERYAKIEKEMEFKEGNVFVIKEVEDVEEEIFELVKQKINEI